MLVMLVLMCLWPQRPPTATALTNQLDAAKDRVEQLMPNQPKRIDPVNSSKDVIILCTSGQQISILNALMSSYLVLVDSPEQMEIFVDQNETKIMEHFKSIRWTQPIVKLFDSSIVTNRMIRSFTRQCVGIVANKSFTLQLIVKSWSNS